MSRVNVLKEAGSLPKNALLKQRSCLNTYFANFHKWDIEEQCQYCEPHYREVPRRFSKALIVFHHGSVYAQPFFTGAFLYVSGCVYIPLYTVSPTPLQILMCLVVFVFFCFLLYLFESIKINMSFLTCKKVFSDVKSNLWEVTDVAWIPALGPDTPNYNGVVDADVPHHQTSTKLFTWPSGKSGGRR